MKRALATALLSMALSAPALAQEGYQAVGSFYLPDDNPTAILFYGDITQTTPIEFKRALEQRPGATTVALASGGGNVYGALTMAIQVFERGLDTVIPQGTWCYSACAYVFLAGDSRKAEGELGVHQISGPDNLDVAGAQYTVSEIIQTLSLFDVNPAVIAAMFRTFPEDMYVFSREEIASLTIERGGSASDLPVFEPKPVPVQSLDMLPPNVTVVAKRAPTATLSEMDLAIPITEPSGLTETLVRIGFYEDGAKMAANVLAEAFPTRVLPVGSEVRVLFGPEGSRRGRLIPYRLSVYDEKPKHVATVALTDSGQYVLGIEPAACTPSAVEGVGGKHDRCR